MIQTGVFKTHPITGDLVEIVRFEEQDFDFNKDFESLDWDTKANFLTFINVPFLSDLNKENVIEQWLYYRGKDNATY